MNMRYFLVRTSKIGDIIKAKISSGYKDNSNLVKIFENKKKNKIEFQKLTHDRIAIKYGDKLVDVISESELLRYLEDKTLDIKVFETK